MLYPYLTQGGPLMWPLLVCSVVLAATLVERAWAQAFRRRGGRPGHGQARPGIHPFFWEVPPQIGLLGTVIGLIQIFRGGLGPEAFGRGVGVACITTVFGLGIALVARSADHLFVAWNAGRTLAPPAAPVVRTAGKTTHPANAAPDATEIRVRVTHGEATDRTAVVDAPAVSAGAGS